MPGREKMKKQWQLAVMVFVLLGSLVMSSFPLAQTAEAKGIVTKIALRGSALFPAAFGTAKYKVDGAEREFQVEVENITSLAGQRLYVVVNGARVGSFVVTSLGTGRLIRNTTRGQNVPFITAGSTVRVKTGAGAVVVRGTF